MKKHFIVLLLILLTVAIANERIKFGVGSSNQRINDISFEFSTKKGDLIRMQIDQISSKGQNIDFEIKDVNYFGYLKWLTGLSSAEIRGFKGIIIIPNESIDFKSSIERTHFEIKNIDVLIDEENERVDLNSLDINYKLTNLEFSVPYLNDSQVDEFINTIVPDGKIPKVEFSISYNNLDKTLKLNGNFRMLSGSGIIDISVMINENDMDLTYVENSSIKLNNLADGLIDYINDIENETNFSITKLGRGSFKIEYSGLLKHISSRYLETIEKSEVAIEDAVINNIMVALENYAQNKMLTEGRRYWPDNPFDALVTKPQTYSLDGTPCDEDNEWTYVVDASDGQFTGYISHQRADNSRYQWSYNKGVNTGTDNDVTGTLYERTSLGTGGSVVLFK